MYVPQFKREGSLYPVILAASASMFIYNSSVGTHPGHKNNVYNKLYKSSEKSKIKDFNSPRNYALLVVDYWSKKIEENFHLNNPGNIILSDKFTTQDVTYVMITMVKNRNSMEQGMTGLQDNFIESVNEREKK